MNGPLIPEDVQTFDGPVAFRSWLERNHDTVDAVWVGFWKKATGRPSMTWEESVAVALCYGWIDGIRKRIDDEAYTIRFTPRRKGSVWSLRNMGEYAELESLGLIRPPGRAAYERRIEKKTGIYSFEQGEPVTLSDEYSGTIEANERAWANWEVAPPGYRKRMAFWIMSAKRAETRVRRVAKLVEDLEAGRR